ncbi:MAG: hypothetical protein ACI8S6_001192 [Myxococcota bacterium]|jgi:hypothetical protein
MIALLLVMHVSAQDPARLLLAPRLEDLLTDLRSAEARLEVAAALGAALGRVHNTMVKEDHLRCDDPVAPSMGWRAEALGEAWRDELQALRASSDRLNRMRDAATVAPLVEVSVAERLNGVDAQLSGAVRAWRAAAGWQSRYVAPWYRRCPWQEPTPQPGLPSATPHAAGETDRIAVLTLGEGGVLCPDRRPAARAVVLDGDTACIDQSDACTCSPAAVLPGAILPAAR